MEALVSIIVPVYNLEGYVDNCIKSLVNQTYQNIEILCIDDGSTDKSAEVIKSFAQKDDRVVYVYKENGGVSSARNLGLDMFKGEYVMFVDGDDYLHPQAVELFVKISTETNSDVVCSNLEETNNLCSQKIISDYGAKHVDVSEIFDVFSDLIYKSACAKLYKKDVVSTSDFPEEITNGEDTIFFVKVLDASPSVYYIDLPLYFYYKRVSSASRSEFKISALTMIDGLDDLCLYLKEKESDYLLSQTLRMLYNSIFSIRTLCVGTEFEQMVLKKCQNIAIEWLRFVMISRELSFKQKVLTLTFFFSRHLYELARLIQDPTMLDFYKNRRKQKGKSQKD